MKIYESMREVIGETPLVELKNIEKEFGLNARILAKMESRNPGGSAKDRIALEMIRAAEASGELRPGGTVGVTLRNKEGVTSPAVPPSAVMQDVQGPYVWVLDAAGKAAKRYIERGRLTPELLFVRSGLKAGERVVTDGTHKVEAGDTVAPAPEAK